MHPAGARNGSERGMSRWLPVTAVVFLAAGLGFNADAVAQVGEEAFLLQIDLSEMSSRLEVRYRWAEKGELPAGYVLFGAPDGPRFLRPGPLEPPPDRRRLLTEYDPVSRSVFVYRVPPEERFLRREERDGVYFRATPRPIDIEGLEISITSIEALASEVWTRQSRRVMREEVAYALTLSLIHISEPTRPY